MEPQTNAQLNCNINALYSFPTYPETKNKIKCFSRPSTVNMGLSLFGQHVFQQKKIWPVPQNIIPHDKTETSFLVFK